MARFVHGQAARPNNQKTQITPCLPPRQAVYVECRRREPKEIDNDETRSTHGFQCF